MNNLSKIISIVILAFIIVEQTFAQFESVQSYHSVYNYLVRKHTEGSAGISPIFYKPESKIRLLKKLGELKNANEVNSELDMSKNIYFSKMFFEVDSSIKLSIDNIFSGNLFRDFLTKDENSYLLFHKDSLFTFSANPIFSYKFMTQSNSGSINNASLVSYGAYANITYSDWLGIYLSAWNGVQSGSREAAFLDEKIKHSFTHQVTKLENFDGTEGYVNIEKDFFSLKFGRERLMWGVSNLNRLTFDSTAQPIDFLTVGFNYKSFSYRFLHGWLVERPDTTFSAITGVASTFKNPKYIAYSRLGFEPNDNITMGAAQTIIYSNRPFEPAYFNPFLLWESAQRSLNDLDNSFWTFDLTWRALKGAVLYGSIMFDDINFNYLMKGDWSTSNNSSIYQSGIRLAYPLMIRNSILEIEYTIARPYAFSHPGLERALSYTNNGYQLGTGIPPNSKCVTVSLNYDISPRINANIRADYIRHGKNNYDDNGNLIENFGGDVFLSRTLITPYYSFLLDGIIENRVTIKSILTYIYSSHLTFDLFHQFNSVEFKGKKSSINTFWISLNIY